MKNENAFLITYGLHAFVAHSRDGGKSVFTIGAQAGQRMIRHATSLITESFGQAVAIQVA